MIFEKKVIEYKWYVLNISTTFDRTFLIIRRTERDMIENVYWSLWKYPLFLFEFNESWIFSQFFEKYPNIKFQENPSSRHADGQTTDMTKLTVAFRNFANAPKKCNHSETKFCVNLLKPTSHLMHQQFNIKQPCAHCIYLFCVYLRTNNNLYHLQHKLIGFYNRDEKCLLCGTNWVFK